MKQKDESQFPYDGSCSNDIIIEEIKRIVRNPKILINENKSIHIEAKFIDKETIEYQLNPITITYHEQIGRKQVLGIHGKDYYNYILSGNKYEK